MSTIFLQYFDNKLVKIKTCVDLFNKSQYLPI